MQRKKISIEFLMMVINLALELNSKIPATAHPEGMWFALLSPIIQR
jgi:hypothetical protein